MSAKFYLDLITFNGSISQVRVTKAEDDPATHTDNGYMHALNNPAASVSPTVGDAFVRTLGWAATPSD